MVHKIITSLNGKELKIKDSYESCDSCWMVEILFEQGIPVVSKITLY